MREDRLKKKNYCPEDYVNHPAANRLLSLRQDRSFLNDYNLLLKRVSQRENGLTEDSRLEKSFHRYARCHLVTEPVNRSQEVRRVLPPLHMSKGDTNSKRKKEVQLNECEQVASKLCQIKEILRRNKVKIMNKPVRLPAEEAKPVYSFNTSYAQGEQFTNHIALLLQFYTHFSSRDEVEAEAPLTLYLLKQYLLGLEDVSADISHIDQVFLQHQEQMRELVFMERLLIISLVDAYSSRTLIKHLHQAMIVLTTFIGMYLFILNHLKPAQNDSILREIYSYGVHLRTDLGACIKFIELKLFPLLKGNGELFGAVKGCMKREFIRASTVNRSFYELLKTYAIYLSRNEGLVLRDYSLLSCFATAPAPYLLESSPLKYTLLLDLHSTLLTHAGVNKECDVYLRPHLEQFLSTLSQTYEVVVYTSSSIESCEMIVNRLPGVSKALYRHHTTYYRHERVKDLSRVGRDLSRVVMVGSREDVLQCQNVLRLSQWDGGEDVELIILMSFLMGVAHSEDVRECLEGYPSFRRKSLSSHLE